MKDLVIISAYDGHICRVMIKGKLYIVDDYNGVKNIADTIDKHYKLEVYKENRVNFKNRLINLYKNKTIIMCEDGGIEIIQKKGSQ